MQLSPQKNDPLAESRRLCPALRSKLPERAAHTRDAPSDRDPQPWGSRSDGPLMATVWQ